MKESSDRPSGVEGCASCLHTGYSMMMCVFFLVFAYASVFEIEGGLYKRVICCLAGLGFFVMFARRLVIGGGGVGLGGDDSCDGDRDEDAGE